MKTPFHLHTEEKNAMFSSRKANLNLCSSRRRQPETPINQTEKTLLPNQQTNLSFSTSRNTKENVETDGS
jgi:hypothetical protein